MYLVIDKEGNTFLSKSFTDNMLAMVENGLITAININTLQKIDKNNWIEIDIFPDDFVDKELQNELNKPKMKLTPLELFQKYHPNAVVGFGQN